VFFGLRPHRIHEMWTIAMDNTVAWASVNQSVCCSVVTHSPDGATSMRHCHITVSCTVVVLITTDWWNKDIQIKVPGTVRSPLEWVSVCRTVLTAFYWARWQRLAHTPHLDVWRSGLISNWKRVLGDRTGTPGWLVFAPSIRHDETLIHRGEGGDRHIDFVSSSASTLSCQSRTRCDRSNGTQWTLLEDYYRQNTSWLKLTLTQGRYGYQHRSKMRIYQFVKVRNYSIFHIKKN